MTLRIEKPAFNLREKLSELDYGKVPYEKMPAGSIIQTAHFQTGNSFTFSNASYTSAYKMKFTPRFASSKLRIHITSFTYLVNASSQQAAQDFQIERTFGATNENTGNSTIVRREQWKNYWNRNSFPNDHYPDFVSDFYDFPYTTEQIVYDFQGRKYYGGSSNYAWRIGYQTVSGGQEAGPSFVWTIQEIRG